MNDYLALLIVVAVVTAPWWAPRLRVWRRCRCGNSFCTTCGTRRGH